MKNMARHWYVPAALVAGLLAVVTPAIAQPDKGRTIAVAGQAEILVSPDQVILTLGVETFDLDLKVARKSNDDRVTAILAAADDLGVTPEDVRTEFLSIQPQYNNRFDHGNFLRFLVRRNVIIKLRDVTRFEELLTSTLESGANYVHGIRFESTELNQHRREAETLAVKSAKENAERMAQQLGLKLGQARGVSRGYVRSRSRYIRWGATPDGEPYQDVQVVESRGVDIKGPTRPGQIAITAAVNITFDLVE